MIGRMKVKGREVGLTLPMAILGLLLAPVLALYLVVYGTLSTGWGALLRLWFWHAHRRQGRHLLFVYSDSPNWQAYIEGNILPRLRGRALVLNWSERKQWRRKNWWAERVFERWAGTKDFNPIAIVFVGSLEVVCVRFFRSFQDFKHDRPETLQAAEAELESWL